MRVKRSLVADIFGYRFLINRDRGTERFYVALNKVPIVFNDNKEVMWAYDELFSTSMISDSKERNKKMNDSLVTLLKVLCKATGIKCENWNDAKVLNVFGS